MDGTADDRYFEWLYSHIGPVNYNNPRHTFWELAKQLYTKKFRWSIENDANRAEEGCMLRDEFVERKGHEGIDSNWMTLPCSFLEMVLVLSDRMAFESYGDMQGWFWKLMENLEVDKYTDFIYNKSVASEINHILDRVLDREYGPDGVGGLFPLRDNHGRDQRRVELWYQKEAYLLEGLSVHNGPR